MSLSLFGAKGIRGARSGHVEKSIAEGGELDDTRGCGGWDLDRFDAFVSAAWGRI
jgi:hypothetical protein